MIEFIISFRLIFDVISVATDSRVLGELIAIAICSTVALAVIVAVPFTGASNEFMATSCPCHLGG